MGKPEASTGVPTAARYVVLAGLCLIAAFAYLSRNSISVAETAIRKDLGLDLDQMGWVMSAFFWSYALAQVPSGMLGQVWGTRRTLSLLAIIWSLATAACGLATGIGSLLLARIVFGAAQAGIFPCSANTVSHWLPLSRRALATGMLGGFMSVGGAAGAALGGLLLQGFQLGPWSVPATSWRWVFALFALPGVAWSVWFYAWFRDRPTQHGQVSAAELQLIRNARESATSEPAKVGSTPWLRVVTSLDMWMICSQQFFRAAGYIFFGTWFPTYLKETRGVSTSEAGLLTSLPLLATVLGAVLGGVLVDWLWSRTRSERVSRQGVALLAMLGCAGFIFLAYFVASAWQAVLLISAGSLLAAFGGPCAYTVTIDKADQHVAPVFGTMNMMGNFGAALCPLVVARFVKVTGNWDLVLLLFVGMYLAAAVAWLLLNPKGTFFDPVKA